MTLRQSILWFVVPQALTWAAVTVCLGAPVADTLAVTARVWLDRWREGLPCTPGDTATFGAGEEEEQCVPVAVADLPAGHRIAAGDVAGRWLPVGYAAAGVVRGDGAGRTVRDLVLAGDLLREERLAEEPAP